MREHACLMREFSALEQIARRAGGHDIFPGRSSSARSRDDVIKGQIVCRHGCAAILALKAVAQEHVEPREGGMARWLDVSLQRDNRRQSHLEGWRMHDAVIFFNDVHALHEHGLDRVLPRPERERKIR